MSPLLCEYDLPPVSPWVRGTSSSRETSKATPIRYGNGESKTSLSSCPDFSGTVRTGTNTHCQNECNSVMPTNSPPTQSNPLSLSTLPSPPLSDSVCPRRTRWQIDLILLAIEALDLGSSQAMLAASEQLELRGIIKNRVSLWRLRNTNPFRRSHTRRNLSLTEAKALVAIACHLARRQTILLRQLLLDYEQLMRKDLPLENHFRLSDYTERFRLHFRSRMNLRRSSMAVYREDDQLNRLAMKMLSQLLFCTGTYGMQRFWTSLFDGEVA